LYLLPHYLTPDGCGAPVAPHFGLGRINPATFTITRTGNTNVDLAVLYKLSNAPRFYRARSLPRQMARL
jgi:hypothetical protein